jgi:hypothetical protein
VGVYLPLHRPRSTSARTVNTTRVPCDAHLPLQKRLTMLYSSSGFSMLPSPSKLAFKPIQLKYGMTYSKTV